MNLANLIKNISLSFLMSIGAQSLLLSVSHAQQSVPQVCHASNCVTVEVVTTQADMERGLMYRTGLGQDKGMLFKFAEGGVYSFWMKNMHFSLDILWISNDGHIVYIGKNIPACTSDPCPVYTPDNSARYVLEINSGYAALHQWKVGDMLSLKGF